MSDVLTYFADELHDEPTTLVLVGPSGAGKTTAAEELRERPDQHVSTDDLRRQLCGDASKIEANGPAKKILCRLLRHRSSHALTTIIDTTALKKTWRRRLAQKSQGTRLWALIVEATADTCVDRQSQRDRQVPESVVRKQHSQLDGIELQAGRFGRVACYHSTKDQLVEVGS